MAQRRVGAGRFLLHRQTMETLKRYSWPGNVRELENCIERAVLLCEEGVVHSYHLPPTLQTGAESDTLPALSLEEAVANLEREMLIDALKNARGNITQAAKAAGMDRKNFWQLMKKHTIDAKGRTSLPVRFRESLEALEEAVIPESIRQQRELGIGDGRNERRLLGELRERARALRERSGV